MPTISSLTNFTFSFILSFQKSQSWYNVSIPVSLLVGVWNWRGVDMDVVGVNGAWSAFGLKQIVV